MRRGEREKARGGQSGQVVVAATAWGCAGAAHTVVGGVSTREWATLRESAVMRTPMIGMQGVGIAWVDTAAELAPTAVPAVS